MYIYGYYITKGGNYLNYITKGDNYLHMEVLSW